ncbi:MAG: peptide chain release factor N(5)-glutamine methyltransferase [Synergistaceae bacterium]
MIIKDIREKIISTLENAKIERTHYEADLILSYVLSLDKALIFAHYYDEVQLVDYKIIIEMVTQRTKRVPLSYILGVSEFYGYTFKVGSGCLIPRPETELLVEEMLTLSQNAKRFADWCTGSGCIGISMLLENPNYSCYAIDASEEALIWAKINAKHHNIEERFIPILNSSPEFCDIEKKSLDFIISNPPYIPSKDILTLMSDVKDYEPRIALDGGEQGLDVYRLIMNAAEKFLVPSGYIAFETAGAWQIELLKEEFFPKYKYIKEIFDYAGIPRHVIFQLK